MKTTKVAVVGGGVGGLTAAGLLAKRGRNVVLFEQAQVLGGKAGQFEAEGMRFDTGPTLLALPHFVRGVFDELGATMPRLHRLTTQCHYVFPDGRVFDAMDDLEQTIDSSAKFGHGLREFYQKAEEIHRCMGAPFLEQPLESFVGFMRAVLKNGVQAAVLGARMGTLDALARSLMSSPELIQFVGRFATYVGASPYRASAAYALIAHIERAYGVHHPEGGMGALARALGDAVVRSGVTLRLGERAQWTHDGKQFTVNGEQFDQLIINADPTPPGTKELSLSGYVLFVRVPRKLDLPHHTIVFADNPKEEFAALFSGRLPDKTTVYLCHPAATDATFAHDNATALYVMVNTPPGLAPEAERVMNSIRHLIGNGATVLGSRSHVDFAATGSPRGALYGAVGHGRLGPFRRPRMRGSLRGQYFVGGGTHPGGGVPMVSLSGRFAAELAIRDTQ